MRKLIISAALAACTMPAFAADACYDDASIRQAVSIRGQLSANTEELVRLAISEGISNTNTYVLGRQMVLVERLHRRLLERSDCAAGSDALDRDFAIMQRIFEAFAEGDAELKIDALRAEAAQALLDEIGRRSDELGAELAKLRTTVAQR